MSSQSISFRPVAVIKQLPWRLGKRATIGYLLILGVFSLIGLLYLGQASMVTSSTMQIDKLNQQISQLSQKNNELAMEIAQAESISRIKARATELGFAPTAPENIRYLSAANYPAVSATNSLIQPNSASAPTNQNVLKQTWLDVVAGWITGH